MEAQLVALSSADVMVQLHQDGRCEHLYVVLILPDEPYNPFEAVKAGREQAEWNGVPGYLVKHLVAALEATVRSVGAGFKRDGTQRFTGTRGSARTGLKVDNLFSDERRPWPSIV